MSRVASFITVMFRPLVRVLVILHVRDIVHRRVIFNAEYRYGFIGRM